MKHVPKKVILQLLFYISLISNIFINEGLCNNKNYLLLNYNGYICKKDNSPINSTIQVNFLILNNHGSIQWQETHPVDVQKGVFDIILGKKRPIPALFLDRNYYITHTSLNTSSRSNLIQQVCPQYLYKTICGLVVDDTLKPLKHQTQKINFYIYDNNGFQKWEEDHFVHIANGKLSKIIGVKQSLNCNFFNGRHYLEIKPDNNHNSLIFIQNLTKDFIISSLDQTYLFAHNKSDLSKRITNDNISSKTLNSALLHNTEFVSSNKDTNFDNFMEEYTFHHKWPNLELSWYLSNPEGIAVDNNNFVYISDTGNCRIRKFSNNGKHIMDWGKCGNDEENFIKPQQLVTDSQNNIYIIDDEETTLSSKTMVVKKYSSLGIFIGKWKILSNQSSFGQIDIDSNDFIYITSRYVKGTNIEDIEIYISIEKYDSNGTLLQSIPLPFTVYYFHDISIFEEKDKIYLLLLNADNPYVSKINKCEYVDQQLKDLPDFSHTIEIFGQPYDADPKLDVDRNGIVYTLFKEDISKISSNGDVIQKQFAKKSNNEISDITLDKDGNIYVSNPVQKFSPTGEPMEGWNEKGAFGKPTVMKADFKRNHICLMDTEKKVIQRFSRDGEIIHQCAWAENSPKTKLNNPDVMAIDDDGFYYLSEPMVDEHCIEQFDRKGRLENSWCFNNKNNNDKITSIHVSEREQTKIVYTTLSVSQLMNKYKMENDSLQLEHSWKLDFIPLDMAIDSQHNFYLLGYNRELLISKYDKNFNKNTDWSRIISTEGLLKSPGNIAIGSDNYLYVINNGLVDMGLTVHKINPEGRYVTNFGEYGSENGQFSSIKDLCALGNEVFISDSEKRCVQVFSKQRKVIDIYKAAIIVAGQSANTDNHFDLPEINSCIKTSYRALNRQGFNKKELFILSSDIFLDLDNNGKSDDFSGKPTKENLNTVLSHVVDTDTLLIYFSGHSGMNENNEGTFRLNPTETLSLQELNVMLEDYSGKLILIADTCHSGSFLPALSAINRIIITSTQHNESAWFLNNGNLSFSSYFWDNIYHGASLKHAFHETVKSISQFSLQHPQFDDNNDGIFNQYDGSIAEHTYIGNGFLQDNTPPEILSVSQFKQPVDSEGLHLSVKVTDDDGVESVWAVIKPQNMEPIPMNTNLYELPFIDLTYYTETDSFENSYNFSDNGNYHLIVYAKDKIGSISQSKTLEIEVQRTLTHKAIIILGEVENSQKQNAIIQNANLAYQALIFQNFNKSNVHVISPYQLHNYPDNPKLPTIDNCEKAIKEWADSGTNDLVIYLSGIGKMNGFILRNNKQLLRGNQVNEWLDSLDVSGSIYVIYDADYSERFTYLMRNSLKPNRIVISSTDMNGIALFSHNGDISFSGLFWKKILSGYSVKNAFQYAKSNLLKIQNKYHQNPIYYSNQQNNSNKTQVGMGICFVTDPPGISSISSRQTLHKNNSANFFVDHITSVSEIKEVEAIIFQPIQKNKQADVLSNPVTIQLIQQRDSTRYEGYYDQFSVSGEYLVSVIASDIYGKISTALTTTVDQAVGPDIYEDDNSLSLSSFINVQCSGDHCNTITPQLHNFHENNDKDWIKFYADPGIDYLFRAEPLTKGAFTPELTFYDTQGIIMSEMPENMKEITSDFKISGIYYVEITSKEPLDFEKRTDYYFSISLPSAPDLGGGGIQSNVLDLVTKKTITQAKMWLDSSSLTALCSPDHRPNCTIFGGSVGQDILYATAPSYLPYTTEVEIKRYPESTFVNIYLEYVPSQNMNILEVNKKGKGVIKSIPTAIDCGINCFERFDKNGPNIDLTLFATPDSGWKFLGWSGECSGKIECVINMNSDKTVNATFKALNIEPVQLPQKISEGNCFIESIKLFK